MILTIDNFHAAGDCGLQSQAPVKWKCFTNTCQVKMFPKHLSSENFSQAVSSENFSQRQIFTKCDEYVRELPSRHSVNKITKCDGFVWWEISHIRPQRPRKKSTFILLQKISLYVRIFSLRIQNKNENKIHGKNTP